MYRISVSPSVHNQRLREQNDIRAWRMYAHSFFDKLWRYNKYGITRDEAYGYLAQHMGLPVSACHMAQFNVAQCKEVVSVVSYLMEEMKKIDAKID